MQLHSMETVYEDMESIELRNRDYISSHTECVLNPRLLHRPDDGVELSSVFLDLRRQYSILSYDERANTKFTQEISDENEESTIYSNENSTPGEMNDKRLAILAGNQNENDYTGAEICFDLAKTRQNEISSVVCHDEPTMKKRNRYIVILPNETYPENVSEESHDCATKYENEEFEKCEDIDTEFSMNLAESIGENYNASRHHVGRDTFERGNILVLQSDNDGSDEK